ncbi:MAG: hypothetical protein JF606_07390 [Burkholderiales bacterium]|nr:hypothetical protein [Burkholderiales bacterium]
MTTSTLSFSIRPVVNGMDLRRACEVRAEGYGHHMPAWRQSLIEPDALDWEEGTLILLCEDKRTGQAIGTARIQTSRQGPLLIEQSASLPESILRLGRAEITRLSTIAGADPILKFAICKAAFLYCLSAQARFAIIGARNEALVRQYKRIGFTEMFPDEPMVPLAHTGGMPHRVLMFDTMLGPREWQINPNKQGLFDFCFETFHPDIEIVERMRAPQRVEAMAA